ncbi:hypothetical protein [Ruegeria arenilitoris]|uniref:hypothetical protein n=1 Tax=Ruegeria arenilitoris TaxID=1173585 RepID=UPI00147F4BF4|nr:hypothetical protein [Ruegeria arenilitoris]
MYNPKIEVFDRPNLNAIVAPDERLIWSGHPEYGQNFLEPVGSERVIHIGLLLGTIAMWSSLFIIEPNDTFSRSDAIITFAVITIMFLAGSFGVAAHRQYVLQNLVYFVTDKRAIVCRYGRNWRLSSRIYVISCPHAATFPYEVIQSRPYPSLLIGTVLSENQLQPFGLGLTHPGHPLLWGDITIPIVFEYIADAQELLQTIKRCSNDSQP